jgi:hypothetical protein
MKIPRTADNLFSPSYVAAVLVSGIKCLISRGFRVYFIIVSIFCNSFRIGDCFMSL